MDAGKTEIVQTFPNIVIKVTNVFNGDLYYKAGTIVTLRCGPFRNPRILTQTPDISVLTVSSSMPSVNAEWAFKV